MRRYRDSLQFRLVGSLGYKRNNHQVNNPLFIFHPPFQPSPFSLPLCRVFSLLCLLVAVEVTVH